MRGCLFVVILAALVVSVVAWFGSPVLASTVISAALENAGYHAGSSTVTATSSPPPKLLLGRADRVEIAGTDVDFRTFHAASLSLVLTDVDVLARTADRIRGRIVGAELKTADGKIVIGAPVLYASVKEYDAKKGGSFFQYLTFRLMLVERKNDRWQPMLLDGEPIVVDAKKEPAFYEKIGKNTNYVIHPDEILADNFVHLVRQRDKLATPRIVEELQRVLEKGK